MAIKSLSIRIDEEMLHKLHVVADYEGRSANSQILYINQGRNRKIWGKTRKNNLELIIVKAIAIKIKIKYFNFYWILSVYMLSYDKQ